MKRAELEALGIEKENIDKIMAMNGKDIETKKTEIANLTEQLETANTQIKEAEKKLKELDSKDNKIQELKDEITAYTEAEKNRAEQEKKDKADRELTDRIISIFPEGKEFTSDYVKNGIIADIKTKMAEDNTLGVKEIFESLTKDKEGIFKNAQHEKLKIHGSDGEEEGEDKPSFVSFF